MTRSKTTTSIGQPSADQDAPDQERTDRLVPDGLDWSDETGAQTAEYGVVTLAAVGFAGVLAVILAGADVQGLLLDLVRNALSLG